MMVAVAWTINCSTPTFETLTIFGDRLYVVGLQDELNGVAEEITLLLDRYDAPSHNNRRTTYSP